MVELGLYFPMPNKIVLQLKTSYKQRGEGCLKKFVNKIKFALSSMGFLEANYSFGHFF